MCRCVVIEDSVIGMQAAKAAGMRCIVTKSRYTEKESFDSADAIFDCIGDAGDERFSLADLMSPGADQGLVLCCLMCINRHFRYHNRIPLSSTVKTAQVHGVSIFMLYPGVGQH